MPTREGEKEIEKRKKKKKRKNMVAKAVKATTALLDHKTSPLVMRAALTGEVCWTSGSSGLNLGIAPYDFPPLCRFPLKTRHCIKKQEANSRLAKSSIHQLVRQLDAQKAHTVGRDASH